MTAPGRPILPANARLYNTSVTKLPALEAVWRQRAATRWIGPQFRIASASNRQGAALECAAPCVNSVRSNHLNQLGLGGAGSIAFAGLCREELLELVVDALEFVGIFRRGLLRCDVGPFRRILGVQLKPLLKAAFRIG